MIAPKAETTPITTEKPRIFKMVNTRQPYMIPGMMGTGGPLPPQASSVAEQRRMQPPELPPASRALKPPSMMGRAGNMRMGLPSAPKIATGQEMKLPTTDPAGFPTEAPNPVGRPFKPRI